MNFMQNRICQLSYKNIIFIIILYCLNPVVLSIFFGLESGVMWPDTIAYITFGNELVSTGKLFLQKWGHVDSGLILPPVYPLLIRLFQALGFDGSNSSFIVSKISIILFIIPLYYYIFNITKSELISFVVVLLVQLHKLYFVIGSSPLTESTYLMMLSLGFYILCKILNENRNIKLNSIYFGIICSLIILTRSVGIVFLFMLIFLYCLIINNNIKIYVCKKLFILVFCVIILPYTIILYCQTGRTIFTQHFRIGEYSIFSGSVNLNDSDTASYDELYAKRRQGRLLLDDGSEMLSHVIKLNNDFNYKNVENYAVEFVSNFINNLMANVKFFISGNGIFFNCVFVILVARFFYLRKYIYDYHQFGLLLFVFMNILIISIFTGLVKRYVEFLFVFAIIFIFIELFSYVPNITKQITNSLVCLLIATILFISGNYSIIDLKFRKNFSEKINNPFLMCKSFINYSDYMFTALPYNSYRIGGRFRVLPNDSIEKISHYAKLTGVNFLLVSKLTHDLEEYRHYHNANWITHLDSLDTAFPELLELSCESNNNVYLYRFR